MESLSSIVNLGTNQSQFALFVATILPGFISLRVWSLIVARVERPFKDELLDAFCFGLLNAVAAAPLLSFARDDAGWLTYVVVVLTFILLPALWPLLTYRILKFFQATRLIPPQAQNAWDEFFLRGEPLFLIIHFDDGRRIGAYYGSESFATLHPNSGYIYVEKLWRLDQDGGFISEIPDSRGIILRPGDYRFIEFLAATFTISSEESDGSIG